MTLLAAAAADFDAVLRQGIAAFEQKDLATARARFESCSRMKPGDGRVWMMLAQTYGRGGEMAMAESAAKRADSVAGADPVVLRGLSYLYSEILAAPARAAAYEERFAALSPDDREAWARASRLYVAAREYPKAERAAKAALERNAYDEQAFFQLAQVYLVQMDFSSAVKAIEAGRKNFDKSAQLELAYGVALYGQRRFAEAITAFLRTIELDPDVEQPYSFLGKVLEHAGDRLPLITRQFALHLERNPESASALLLQAKALAAQLPPSGYPPAAAQAEELLGKALHEDARNAEAHYELGCLLERKRDFASAAKSLESSVALDPKLAEGHYHLSRVYQRLGRADAAAAQLAIHARLTAESRKAGMDAGAPGPSQPVR